ncbi:MAG: hypothetical protein WB930_16045 [Syntrophobacteraceae bacterium]
MDEINFLEWVTGVHGPLMERLVEARRLAKLLQKSDLGRAPRDITLLREGWKGRHNLIEIRRLLSNYIQSIDELPILPPEPPEEVPFRKSAFDRRDPGFVERGRLQGEKLKAETYL